MASIKPDFKQDNVSKHLTTSLKQCTVDVNSTTMNKMLFGCLAFALVLQLTVEAAPTTSKTLETSTVHPVSTTAFPATTSNPPVTATLVPATTPKVTTEKATTDVPASTYV